MQLERICELNNKDYYMNPEKIDPPKNISFTIERREDFWEKDKKFVYVYNDSKNTNPSEEKKAFDFEKEILKFRGGHSRDHKNRMKKQFNKQLKRA